MTIGKRILSGTLANSAGIGMTALLQLVSVPVLASAWGAERFGMWMMLTTIPTYFALTDLGFVQAATSDMTMQLVNGRKNKVVVTFQSASLLVLIVCLAVVSAAVLGVSAWTRWSNASFDNVGLIALLASFSALSLISRMGLCSLLATGHYALGMLSYSLLVLLEGLASLLTAWLGGGFIEVAQTLMVMRLINILAIYGVARWKVPWLKYGLSRASGAELRRLLKPALAAMTIPIALSINLQGVVLVIGAILSPTAVAIYTPVRTCSRLLIQIIGVVNRASMPELAKAYGSSKSGQVTKILRLNGLMLVALLLPGSIAFAVAGELFVKLWSAGHIVPDQSFVILIALATLVHGSWYFTANLLMATNSHVSIAKYSLLASVFTLLAVWLGAKFGGLDGAGLGVLAGELILAVAVIRIYHTLHHRLQRAPHEEA